MRQAKRNKLVFAVVVDEEPGWCGNGDRVYRFLKKAEAISFASGKTWMGSAASVSEHRCTREQLRRWGLA